MGIKQKISILLTLVFVLVAVGCGGSNSIETQKKANVSEQTSTHKMEEEKQSPSVASTPKVVTHILGASRQEVDALMKSKKYQENKEIHDDNEVNYRLRNEVDEKNFTVDVAVRFDGNGTAVGVAFIETNKRGNYWIRQNKPNLIELCTGGADFPVRTNNADNPTELYIGDIDTENGTEQSTKQQDTREDDGRVILSY